MSRWIYFCVVCLLVWSAAGQESTTISEDEETTTEMTTVDPGPDPVNPYKYYAAKQEKLIKVVAADVVEFVAPHFVTDIHELKISGDCTYGLLKFVFGLKKFKPWSIKMLDSWGKIPTGVFYGALSQLGNMNECKAVVAEEKKYNGRIDRFFTGKYCAINIKPYIPFEKPKRYDPRTYLKNLTDEVPFYKNLLGEELNMAYFYFAQFRVGACVPDSCSLHDMNIIVKQMAIVTQVNITVPWCEGNEPVPFSGTQAGALVALALIFALSAIGTIIDVTPKLLRSMTRSDGIKAPPCTEKSRIAKVAECFSVYSNIRKVLNTETGSTSLRCIHGIRVITMAWIILGDTFIYKNLNVANGLFEALQLAKIIPFQMVFNVFPAVDTFVTISGCLLAFTYLQKLDENQGRLSYFRLIIRRWWRLTPAFIAVSFMMILLPHIGSGPVWRETLQPFASQCEKNWWSNLFYIGTYFSRENMCLPYGWYLSCDFHYFVIAPFIIYLLYKRALTGLLVIFGLIAASIATVGSIVYLFDLPPIPLFIDLEPDHFTEYMDLVGYKPYTHLAPFCIGMTMGYMLHKQRRRRINKVLRLPVWVLVWVLQMALVFGVRNWNAYDRPSVELGVLYGAFFRTLWSLCVAWTVYACATGNGGLINTILSWKTFVPLSRLTFLVYLIHPLVILAYTAYLREPYYITIPFMSYIFLGHLFASYSLSLFLTVTLESPFLAIDRLITKTYENTMDPLGHHPYTKRNPPILGNGGVKVNPIFIETGDTMKSEKNGRVNPAFDNAKL